MKHETGVIYFHDGEFYSAVCHTCVWYGPDRPHVAWANQDVLDHVKDMASSRSDTLTPHDDQGD